MKSGVRVALMANASVALPTETFETLQENQSSYRTRDPTMFWMARLFVDGMMPTA